MKRFMLLGLVAWVGFAASDSRPQSEAAKLINESLLENYQPCEDFHSYACGGWENEKPTGTDLYSVLEKELDTKLEGILRSIVPNYTNQRIVDKLGIIYKACLASPEPEGRGDGLYKVLSSYGLGDWPIVDKSVINTTLATNATNMFLQIGIRGIFDVYVKRDPTNSTSRILQIHQPPLYNFPESAFKNAIKEAALFMKNSTNVTMLMKVADRVWEYSRKLYNLYGYQTFVPKPSRKATIQQLERNFSNIPLLMLLNKEFGKVDITLTEEDVVEIHPFEFYKDLSKFLVSADPITMFNFAGLRVMWNLGDQASAAFRSEVHKLWYEPVTSAPTRKQECIHLVKTEMTDILAYHYAERTHNASVKAEVEDIAKRIKNAFQGMFLNNSWIDSGKKDALLDKLNKTRIRVGYPDGLINASLMEQLYDYVPHISVNTTFVEIWHNVSEGRFRRQLKKFRDPYSEHEITLGVRAYYDPHEDEVEIPWSLLHAPVYESEVPRSLNYGGIGAIIGHELSRAFDTQGNHLEGADDLTWSKLDNRTQCFVNQYEKYPYVLSGGYGSFTFNGTRTLDENIADNIGLQSAYNAYVNLPKDDCDGLDTRLQGLEKFSGEALLFIARAMESCKNLKYGHLALLSAFGTVSPSQHRVNVPMKNSGGFAAAFNCSEGSPTSVTSNETCVLW